MAQRKIRLMISSRCKTELPLDSTGSMTTLSEVRVELKAELESEGFLGGPLLEVWINEEESKDTSQNAWEACCKEARDCDIFLGIFDGDVGWQINPGGGGVGICQAELEEARANSHGKVRIVRFAAHKSDGGGPNDMFINALKVAKLWESRYTKDASGLKKKVKFIVREQVLQLCHEGARELKRSGPNSGQALDWQRLNYKERQKAMLSAARNSLLADKGAEDLSECVAIQLGSRKIVTKISAVPAAFSVSAARELVGQPFLSDHDLADLLVDERAGPIHLILCNRTVSESQAIQLLGFPDATIVHGSFGTYIADNIQKIQICLITNCRDIASTRHGIQRLFEWLQSTEEDEKLITRAISRSAIVLAINKEQS